MTGASVISPLPDVTCFFHPVLAARELGRAPVRVQLANVSYVLFRGPDGKPAALLDRCPHRFAPLSQGKIASDGRLQCPYHGWRFDAQGQGQSPTQPELKKCDVPAMQVVEKLGYLWLTAPDVPPSAFPAFDPGDYTFNGAFAVPFAAPLHVVLDNFSEDEHTPFVHTRLGWDEAHTRDVQYEAHNLEDRTEVVYRAPQRASMVAPLLMIRAGDTFHNQWTTRFDPVRTDYRIHWTGPNGAPRPFFTRALIFMVPETDRTTVLHVFSFMRVTSPALRLLRPALKRAALVLSRREIEDDARFIPTVADTPFSFRGMRLGRYDKPLIHNHKLLERIYLQRADEEADPASPPLAASR